LPASFRAVFVMRVVEQMSIEETAAALSIPEATVKTRLHRANQQLRQALGSEFASIFEGAFPFAGSRCERLTAAVLARLSATEPIRAASRH
jgi:RNA polymerase sigma-70 factor (ECF subfamily)